MYIDICIYVRIGRERELTVYGQPQEGINSYAPQEGPIARAM